ncbi:MAG: MBL fold metallo-hydrolase [Lachnospiraceae bacterium]|nr:MBL fold metallo-hydrolase [Lachnospiraceae bacterium]
MTEKIYYNPDIYKIYVPLPNNPLKNLNCYIVKTPEKNLIIDTGFNIKECYEALMSGIKELNIDMANTEMFLTHLHSDHVGLAGSIMPKDGKIYMSKADYDYFVNTIKGDDWDIIENIFVSEGFPKDSITVLRETNPARAYAPDESFNAITVEDGEKICVGEYELTCVFTPGHTPGHMCLYLEKEKLMFLGDHVLFDITPNITFWNYVDNSLLNYMKSLEKIKTFSIDTALPAHRKNDMDFYVRVEEILKHHQIRLDECLRIVTENPGLHAYDIGGKMQWSMRGRNWAEFPMHQKWFAVGETIAHLDYLRAENKIYKEEKSGINLYYPK